MQLFNRHDGPAGIDFVVEDRTRLLRVAREPLIGSWVGCDTCAITLVRAGDPPERVRALADRLRAGDVITDDLRRVVKRILPAGRYETISTSAIVRATRRGDEHDYFDNDCVVAEFDRDVESNIEYWSTDPVAFPITRAWDRGLDLDVPVRSQLFHLLVPLEPIATLDPKRIAHYRERLDRGERPMSVGVSVLDVRSPANARSDPYPEHWTLTTYILDGHHRLQAAADLGVTARLVTFLSRAESINDDLAINAVVTLLASPAAPR